MELEQRLEAALGHLGAGRWFEAHVAFEDLWREASGPVRSFYQGLAQVAAGFVKLDRGQPASARTLILKGLARIEATPAGHQAGLDGDGYAAALRRFLESLEGPAAPVPPLLFRRSEPVG